MLDKIFGNMLSKYGDCHIDARGDDFLAQTREMFGLQNVAYLGVNLPARNKRNFFVHNTYSATWAAHYESSGYVNTDPIVKLGLTAMMPFDWSELDRGHAAKILGESRDFGVGMNGLSFPVHGMDGETAVFSFTSSLKGKDWRDFKRFHIKEMRIIAEFFHQRMVNSVRPVEESRESSFTNRELECLRWSAEGKTYDEIGTILNISSRTVRFFLENARSKLGAINTTQAVVSAISRGLI